MEIHVRTSWGTIVLAAEAGRVKSCRLPTLRGRPRKPFRVLGAAPSNGVGAAGTAKRAERFIKECFAGGASALPSFDLPEGPAFHRKVWKALLRIPAGRTQSYGELARRIGHPRAARAVGQACGANPLPLLIPCHRVTAANGRLGGFSCGLPWKELLLQRERGESSNALEPIQNGHGDAQARALRASGMSPAFCSRGSRRRAPPEADPRREARALRVDFPSFS